MRPTTLRRGLALVAAVPLLAGLVGCGGSNNVAVGQQTCEPLPTADPAAKLPAGFPALGGQVLYDPTTQGKTQLVFALVEESSFVQVRDDLVDKLKAAGYTIASTDQESVEAEAEFTGPQEGTIKVQPLCKGYITVRYKFLG